MFNSWIPLHRYKILRSTDDPEAGAVPQVRCIDWLAVRRVRTALIAGALLLALFCLSRFVDLPTNLNVPEFIQSNSSFDYSLGPINWSDFAYVQYVTNGNYLCNSLMILESLYESGSKADRIMMYPKNWHVPDGNETDLGTESKLLAQARDLYGTKLIPIEVQTLPKGDMTWRDSYTKLLAFNQTQYKRLISLDSDATVKDHMDELFLTPSAPVAMPRAYWLEQPFLSSQLILLEPSEYEWHRIQEFMNRDDSGFDMDILNTMYKDSCIILPHRRYNMLSAEFRTTDHSKYLGSPEAWDSLTALQEAKFVHFSDWPVPKPWLKASGSTMADKQPKCIDGKAGSAPDCTDRDIWLGLYRDFSVRRQRVCGHSYDRKRRQPRLDSPAPRPRYEPIIA